MLAYSILSLQINKLKQEIKERFGLNWTEYLILCAIDKLASGEGSTTPIDVHNELRLNKGWTYKEIDQLESKNLLLVGDEANPWHASSLSLTFGGKLVLSSAEHLLNDELVAHEHEDQDVIDVF